MCMHIRIPYTLCKILLGMGQENHYKYQNALGLDSRSRSCRFEHHWGHFVVSLSKTFINPLLSAGSTQEDQSRHDWKNVDWDVKNQERRVYTSGVVQ